MCSEVIDYPPPLHPVPLAFLPLLLSSVLFTPAPVFVLSHSPEQALSTGDHQAKVLRNKPQLLQYGKYRYTFKMITKHTHCLLEPDSTNESIISQLISKTVHSEYSSVLCCPSLECIATAVSGVGQSHSHCCYGDSRVSQLIYAHLLRIPHAALE